jgi:ATP-dependent Clp protease adaptor protein ClpS
MTSDTIVEKKTRITDSIKEPGKFKVVVCNDDTTPVEFVISLLVLVFKHTEKAALELTLQIHNSGRATVGVYSNEIAEQKAVDATNLARSHGWPLITKVEPE